MTLIAHTDVRESARADHVRFVGAVLQTQLAEIARRISAVKRTF